MLSGCVCVVGGGGGQERLLKRQWEGQGMINSILTLPSSLHLPASAGHKEGFSAMSLEIL